MIKKLAVHIGQYKKYALLVPIFVLLDVAAELSMPILMARIVDIGIPTQDIRYIAGIGGIMVVLAMIAIAMGTLFMKYSSIAAFGFGANLRNALFEKVQAFSFKNIDHFSTASLVTRLTNDSINLQNTFMMIIRLLLRGPIMLVIAFIFAYNINAQLSLVLAVAIPALVIAILAIIGKAINLFSIMQNKIDDLNRTLQENLIGIRVVKSFVRYDFEKEKFKDSNDGFTKAAIDAATLAVTIMPLMMLIMNASVLAVIWFGGKMVFFGTLGAGELIGFISYIMQILMSVMMISMVIVMSARAIASGERILEVLETDVDIKDYVTEGAENTLPAVRKGKVEFKNVSFKYDLAGSGEHVISNISFVANPGEIIGVVGGTGTGKTTMVNLIPRLYDAVEGSVLVDDTDVREYALDDLRRGVGVVLQNNTLFSGTIRENLLWGNENATQAEIEQACKDAQAHEFIMSFPDGYETNLGQGGVNVSGGQKQRLCIARAMLKHPRILILDDSTSAVDSATEAKIRASFYEHLSHTTVFIIAQRISSVSGADKIVVIDDGKIVDYGNHQDLMESSQVYQEIYTSQQEGVLANG
ncbi:MAG: ABC transporter ATP-binding protein [Anaerolineaceae bacterium]|nr:ABC transporter ATP-binding protein [Anaerolineaceae bacterium]